MSITKKRKAMQLPTLTLLFSAIMASCTYEYYPDSCQAIKTEIIEISQEDPYPEYRITKIYEPREIARSDTEIKCEGIASWGDATETKIVFRAYEDREGEWMLEFGDLDP